MDTNKRIERIKEQIRNKDLIIKNRQIEIAELEKEMLDLYEELDHAKKELANES